jgi:hypothetical protein
LAASRDDFLHRIKHRIDIKKCLISILWSVTRIHSLLDVPKETMYKRAFFRDAVMPSLIEDIT